MANTARIERAGDSAPPPSLRLVTGPEVERALTLPDNDADPIFGGLRVVRTLAMLSIVGYHVSWEPIFGIAFGLTSLQVIMCALTARGLRPAPFSAFARKRAQRLLAPWILWSALYAVFEVVRAFRNGSTPAAFFEPWMWFSGSSFHLWFLPFAFTASLAVHALQRAQRLPRAGLDSLACSLAGAALLVAVDPLKAWLQPSMPFDLWIDGAPTVLFGLAVGRTLTTQDSAARAKLLLAVVLASLIPLCLSRGLIPQAQLFERYAIAVPVVCLGFMIEIPSSRWIVALASANLGVYLVHMLIIRALDHLPGALELNGVERTLLVYATCCLAVLCLRRTRVPHLT